VGKKARELRAATVRKIRDARLSEDERAFLRASARYEGSPLHKARPNDFGLTPPTDPRQEKNLCDEAGVFQKAVAQDLLKRAIDAGLVSEASAAHGYPKQLWVVHEGRVFEAMYGGSQAGCYHGYPIRRSDPFSDDVLARWSAA
jgi:hypothetical protein